MDAVRADVEALWSSLAQAGSIDPGEFGALHLGDGGQWIVDALERHGISTQTVTGNWPAVQLERRFGVVIADASGDRGPAVAHCAVQHAAPGGLVVLWAPDNTTAVDLAARFDLSLVVELDLDGVTVRVHRRTERFTIHDLVFEARSSIRRVDVDALAVALRGSRPPLIIDTRTHTDRQRFGVISGAIHAPSTVVEWHLDPANGYRHPAIESLDDPLVIVCNGGYSSSLAAANLTKLGFTNVADLVGGMHAWTAGGHPVVEPDHSHLDL
jgi:rhodanese-related sulfurtransferase